MNMVRWGIIGCGDVAEKKSGPALYKAEGSELVAVMRRDLAKAEDFARRHGAWGAGDVRAYNTVDDLLSDPNVDAVYIATPPALHLPKTLQAAKAGKRVLVEKPMALNTGEAQQMIQACQDAGVSLHVAYYRRFYPKFVHAKKLINEGAIGLILGARLQLCNTAPSTGWRVDPSVSGGGHLLDVGSHRLDMLVYLLGEPAHFAGFSQNRLQHHAAENDAVLTIAFKSGVVASVGFHFHTKPSRDVLEIYGETGTLTFDPFDSETFTINGEPHTYPTPSPVHLPFIQALVDTYRGSNTSHVTGEQGLWATRLCEATGRRAQGAEGNVAQTLHNR